MKKISQQLLEILVCPKCQGQLQYDEANQELVCQQSQLAYSIKDGIPIMLIEEARNLTSQT
jgi:uncharacterized protein YbaR (Trm112 family)